MDHTEFTSYIAPDGSEYKFDTVMRTLLTEEGLGMPPIEYLVKSGPFQHGSSLIDFRLQPRTIQMVVRQNSYSRTEFWQNRTALLNGIRPNKFSGNSFGPGKLRKIFEDGSIRDLDVIIDQGPSFTARDITIWDEWGFTETLRFIAHDPTFYDPATKSVEFSAILDPLSDDHLVFPLTFPIELGAILFTDAITATTSGNWKTFPSIKVYGPIGNFVIENVSTKEIIRLGYNVPSGDVVTISLEYGNKFVTDQNGVNLIGTVSSDSDLATFHLAPDPEVSGGVNVLSVSTSSLDVSSRIVISYNDRFIGL